MKRRNFLQGAAARHVTIPQFLHARAMPAWGTISARALTESKALLTATEHAHISSIGNSLSASPSAMTLCWEIFISASNQDKLQNSYRAEATRSGRNASDWLLPQPALCVGV